MKVEGTYTFQAPQERVWEVLNSPVHLQPGPAIVRGTRGTRARKI